MKEEVYKNKCIGRSIKTIRKSLGFSQSEFANAVGISNSFLSGIESGKKYPSLNLITDLNEKFNVNISFIFTGKGNPFAARGAIEEVDPAVEKKRRELIGEDMLERLEELEYYLHNSPIVRYAVTEFFNSYKFDKRNQIEEDIEKTRQKLGAAK